MVLFIHHEAGNYGWAVLFRYSFGAGKYPAEMLSHVSMSEYARAFATGLQSLGPQLAPWILLGILAWRKDSREILTVVVMCVAAHFLVYPSPEGDILSGPICSQESHSLIQLTRTPTKHSDSIPLRESGRLFH